MDYIQKIIREVSNAEIKELLLTIEKPKDDKSLIERYKKEAARIMKTKLFKNAIRTIVEQSKNKIAFESVNNDAVQFNRGVAHGMKLLEGEISRFNVLKDYYNQQDLEEDNFPVN